MHNIPTTHNLQTTNIHKKNWGDLYLTNLQKKVVFNRENPHWGHLILTWHEKKKNTILLTHYYALCIDRHEWNFYFDCNPRKIYVKCLIQLIARPLHIFFKTLYHLSIIGPLIYEISQKNQAPLITIQNTIKSIADIVLTPLYGLAIIITSVALLCLSPFHPDILYTGRTWIGKIEQMANWGEKDTNWTLTHCFQPQDLNFLESYQVYDSSHDTEYMSSDPLERQMTNFARSLVRNRRKHYDQFDCTILPKNSVYVSAVLTSDSGKNSAKLAFAASQ